MKHFRRKELRANWSDVEAMLRSYRAIWKSSPVLRRFYGYLWRLAMEELDGAPIVELGGGSGMIHEVYPEVITTDILLSPGTDMVCNAIKLPFADGSVGGYLCVAFFHHCYSPRRLFQEIHRTLKPGGRMVIIDPYMAPLSRFLYHFATDEDMVLSEAPFETDEVKQKNPLLEANVARATIVFKRNLALFQREFPELQVREVRPLNLFTHLVAGSFCQKSWAPGWCYPIVAFLDGLLQPVSPWVGLAMRVVIEKRA